jgi:endonuclease YncB( thermonuclease family)
MRRVKPQVRSVLRLLGLLLLVALVVGTWQALAPQTTPPGDAGVPPSGTGEVWTVVQVIDGDTVVARRDGVTEHVRLIAIDTPERDRCGYTEARDALAALVGEGTVHLVPGSPDDRDGYGRLLRYLEVDTAAGRIDAGERLLGQGLAVAVFDSRRGYPRHDREDAYFAADDDAADLCPDVGASGTSSSLGDAPRVVVSGL